MVSKSSISLRNKPSISIKNIFIISFIVVLIFAVISQFLSNNPDWRIIFSDIALPLVEILVIISLIYAAIRSSSLGRRIQIAWILITIAMTSYFLGDIIWAIIELYLNQNPFPSIADVFYLLFYPFFALGLYFLPRFSFSKTEKLKIFIDMSIVIISVGLIYWTFLVLPTLLNGQEYFATIVSIVYIIGDFLLLFVLLRLLYSKVDENFVPILLLSTGILALIITDSIFSYQTLQGTYVSGGLLDTGWVLSFILIGIAAFIQASEESINLEKYFKMRKWLKNINFSSYLPLLWVVVAFILLAWANENQSKSNQELLEIGVGIIILLVIVRQVITLNENRILYVSAKKEIENRKIAEDKANNTMMYYKTIFENTGTSVIIIDEDMIISKVNSEAERLIGYSKEEIEGKKKWTEFILDEDLNRLLAYFALRNDPTAHPREYETRVKDKTGNTKYIMVNIVTIPGTNKQLASILDISERKKAEITLSKSEERLKLTLDAVNEGVWDWNVPTGDAVFSPSYYTLLGYEPYEFPENYDSWKNLVHPEDIGRAENEIGEHLESGEGYAIEIRMKTKSGKWIWVLSKGRVVERDEQGHPLRLVGTHSDINKRKKVENELVKSEERFRTLIYNSTDLIRILDEKGLIKFDSPSSVHILGYPEGSLVGRNPMEFIHPEDLERVKNDLKEVYENRNPGTPTEFRIRKSDGTYLPVESISQNLTHVPSIEGILVTTHPIKERKEMEDALKESKEKYKNLFESDPDYTFLMDLDGTIQDVNLAATKFIGLTREKMVGKKLLDLELIHETDIKTLRESFSKVIDGQLVKPFQLEITSNKGVKRWVESKLVPLESGEKVNAVMIIATDITERKMATDKLKTSIKEKEILIQEIHHRVKNNMQIISSLLNLQSRYVEDEEATDVLKESQHRVKSMAMIHEKLYQSEDLTHLNFVDYIQSLVSNLFYSYNVDTTKIKSRLEIEDLSLNMETAVPCGLIISELVSNSLKYAFPNDMSGEILVSLKSVDDYYELIEADNGVGLPEDIDFNTLDSLGLLLVNSLTEQLDGEITINRVKGTEFKIKFKESVYNKRI